MAGVDAAGADLPKTAIDETVRHTLLQISTPADTEGYDEEALQTMDGKSLAEGTPEELAGTVDLDDLPILMSLFAEARPLEIESVAHWVLDEAEDCSVFELHVLGPLGYTLLELVI